MYRCSHFKNKNTLLWVVPVYQKVIGDWGGTGKSHLEPGTVLGTNEMDFISYITMSPTAGRQKLLK